MNTKCFGVSYFEKITKHIFKVKFQITYDNLIILVPKKYKSEIQNLLSKDMLFKSFSKVIYTDKKHVLNRFKSELYNLETFDVVLNPGFQNIKPIFGTVSGLEIWYPLAGFKKGLLKLYELWKD